MREYRPSTAQGVKEVAAQGLAPILLLSLIGGILLWR
jgi:hypothetical protein